jgi:hypothetical protein
MKPMAREILVPANLTITVRALWLETHALTGPADKIGHGSATSSTVVYVDRKNHGRERPVIERGANDQTKPIGAVDSQ